jgi:hypothetical protein
MARCLYPHARAERFGDPRRWYGERYGSGAAGDDARYQRSDRDSIAFRNENNDDSFRKEGVIIVVTNTAK